MSASEVDNRTRGFSTYPYLVLNAAEDEPVGFAVFRGRGSEIELWQAGVIPEKRRQGAGSFLLEQGEREMARLGYREIAVNTYNRWNIMISMLFRRNYRLVSTAYSERREDLKMHIVRELRERKELRYSLTEKCNFNCLFCHNEGLGKEDRPQVSDRQVLEILTEAVRLGHTDITFTGGEPLLKKKRLFFIMEGLAQLSSPPDLTLVTNASLMDWETIDRLRAYPGRKKINLSLHAIDEESFRIITRSERPGVFDSIRRNVTACTEAGLDVKVNFVVLQGLNHDTVAEAAWMARRMGAITIKFIELLVLPENPDDYRMYYDAEAICDQLSAIGDGPYFPDPRKREYLLKEDTRFVMEVQRLTCSLGCSHCLAVRDRTFSSDLQYHPCFIRSRKRFRIEAAGQLDSVFRQGDRIINGYAAKYMDSSPTLVQKEIYVPSKQEMFFAVDDAVAIRDYLERKQFNQVAALRFHEEYFRPHLRTEAWDRFERVLKIGWDYHHETRVELIYTDHEYFRTPGGLITKTRFLDPGGPLRQKSAGFARHFLNRLDFEHFMTLEWDIEIWYRKDFTINLAVQGPLSTLKIDWSESREAVFAALSASYPGRIQPLMMALPELMLNIVETDVTSA